MKVLHIESGKNLYGGAQQVFFLLKNLPKHGVESVLMCDPRSAIRSACEREGIATCPTPIAGDLDLSLPFKIGKLCKQIRPDIVHIHSRRGVDFWGGWTARRMGIPCVLSRRVDNPEPRWIVKRKYGMYNRVITISDGIRQVLLSEGLDDERITLVRSAVDFSSFPPPISRDVFLQRFGLSDSNLVIGCAAQLIERKGHRFLIEALPGIVSQFPQIRVLLFGKGSQETLLKQQVSKLGLDHIVSFPGFVDDIKSIYPHLDILVHPALMEGLGVALIEASYCKLPIIAARAGGIPEIVHDQETGLLVEPGQSEPIKDAILTLLNDVNLRNSMGDKAYALARDTFSVDPMVDGNFQVYLRILKECS